ncbi:hypothetical protein HOL34_02230 [bacterium]|jgi:predicted RNA-binding protein with PIN domain|nr:hypothetical protein [bacterium]MBT3903703.1 hypothetical protein [bacterium]MBT4577460.1 hypothetical protein [bacterium]MBT5345832.1 hypothetical protein [bacterium]MBT6131280.1 hypothetical protein [bacterium]
MFIIIDGYNILKQLTNDVYVSEKERYAFVKKVAKYHAKTRHSIVIVFDGGHSNYPEKERHHGIEVVYAGSTMSADEYIKQHVKELGAKEIVLVSQDRALCEYVGRSKVICVDPPLFYKKITRPSVSKSKDAQSKPETNVVKTTGERDLDIDSLMQEAAEMHAPDKQNSDMIKVESGVGGKGRRSKKDRALLKIWDKL